MLWFDAMNNDDTSASKVCIYEDVKGELQPVMVNRHLLGGAEERPDKH
jgi:hypothetical protein